MATSLPTSPHHLGRGAKDFPLQEMERDKGRGRTVVKSLILIVLGICIIIFSFPKIRIPIMARLFNEGIVAPRVEKPESAAIIKYTGANITLFAIGVILIFIGIIA